MKKIAVSSSCVFYEKDGIWFVHAKLPLLMHVNLKINKVDFIKVIPNEEQARLFLFRGIFVNDNKIILIPCNAKHLVIYLKDEDNFKHYSIEQACSNMFRGYMIEGDFLTFIPNMYNKIVKFNYKTNQIRYEAEWKSEGENTSVIGSGCRDEGKYLFTIWGTPCVLVYCSEKDKIEKKQLDENLRVSQIITIEDKYYIYDMNSQAIISYDKRTLKKCKSVVVGYKDAWMFRYEDKLVLSAVETNSWNLYDENLTEYFKEENEDHNNYDLTNDYYCIEWAEGKDVLYGINHSGQLISIRNNRPMYWDINIDQSKWNVLSKKIMSEYEDSVLTEDALLKLDVYINYIMKR
mgnify:FL=1